MGTDADVVVVGVGAAGIAAARAAHAAGARVAVVAAGDGSLALGTGVIWGTAREPFTQWAGETRLLRPGGRYVTVAGWMLAGCAGAITSVLDLDALGGGGILGVVDLPAHPSWSARLVAQTLGGRVVPVTHAPKGDGFLPVAAALDADGAAESLATRCLSAREGLSGLLFPPVLGLQRTDVAARMEAVLGLPVGEAAGGAGDPPGVRLHRVLRGWLPEAVTLHRGQARMDPAGSPGVSVVGGATVTAGAVVLATGGLTGGGLVFDGSLTETVAGLTVWTRGRQRVPEVTGAQRGMDPAGWFGETADTRRAVGAGLRTDTDGRVLDADGETPVAHWLFAAGDGVTARDPEAVPGITDALAAGALAGASAARHAMGR